MIRLRPLVLIVLSLGPIGPAFAQDALRPVDTTEVLVPSRSSDSIRADRERIDRFRSEANRRHDGGRLRLAEAQVQVELFEKAIEAVDLRIRSAKKEKREADKTVAEAEKKDLERRKNLMERRRELREAEVELAEAEVTYAERAGRALDFEQQLERKRLDSGERSLLLELERKTLEAKLEQETHRRSLVDRRVRLVERQLSLMQAQVNFSKR
jgi:hypothetical protein